MNKILLSACLLGQKVRYDGGDCLQNHPRLQEWFKLKRIITICPEMIGGLATPRPPAEIQGGRIGSDVLNNSAKVVTNLGNDVTSEFIIGAQKTLALAKRHNIQVAILKAKSPSCGSKYIYDGTFSRNLIDGMGVAATLLNQHGVKVFDEDHIDEALDLAESIFECY